MKTDPKSREPRGRPTNPFAGAILDGVLGIVIAIVATALFAMVRDGFEPGILLIAGAYVALLMFVARRRGWSLDSYVKRLRESPNGRGEPEQRSRLKPPRTNPTNDSTTK